MKWTNLPLTVDDIERIEVIRGPNAASYGSNSFLSVINIITFHASDTAGTFSKITRGTDNISDAYLRYGNTTGDLSYRLSLGYNHDTGFENRPDTHTVRLSRFRADYQASTSDSVGIQMGTNKGPKEYHENTLQTTAVREIDNRFAQIRWAHQINTDEEFNLQFFYNAENKDEKFDTTVIGLGRVVADNAMHSERYDLEFQHFLPVTINTRMVWGLGVRQDSVHGVDVFGTNLATVTPVGKKSFTIKCCVPSVILNGDFMKNC